MVNTLKTDGQLSPADLRVALARHDLSQLELAEALGVSPQYVSAVLKADRTGKHVSQAQLRRFAREVSNLLDTRD